MSQYFRSDPTLLSGEHLADEIWMEIFDWYAALWCTFRATAPQASALILGQICRRWRALALLIPQLWNHPPIIYVTRKLLEKKHVTEGWKEFLGRSGSLPLKLHLFFETCDGTRFSSVLQPFIKRSVTPRWEHLTISNLTIFQTEVLFWPAHKNIPRLSSLTLNLRSYDFVPHINLDIFELAPKLTRVNSNYSPTDNDNSPRIYLPWGQLTSYTKIGISTDAFPTIFKFKSMERLRCRGRDSTHSAMPPLSHRNLRHLIIELQNVDQFWQQLERVTLPALETFSLSLRSHSRRLMTLQDLRSIQVEPPHLLMLRDLVVRSSCSLKKLLLNFHEHTIDPPGIAALLPYLSDLEVLEIGTNFELDFAQCVLAELVVERGKATLLPQLRSLTLHYGDVLGNSNVISRLAASREGVFIDDAFPSVRVAPLEHVRIVVPYWADRYRPMCQVGGWEDQLGRLLHPKTNEPLTSYDVFEPDPEPYTKILLSYSKKRHSIAGHKPAPELLSLFTLAQLVEDVHLRQRILKHLNSMGMTLTIQIHMLQNRWIPGCKNDILYVHPNHYDVSVTFNLWGAIANAELKRIDSLLGYHLTEVPEDDLGDEC